MNISTKLGLTAVSVAAAVVSLAPGVASASTARPAGTADAVFCPYEVNGTGVAVRSTPNRSSASNIMFYKSKPAQGLASQTLYNGSGLTWRKAFGGYMASEYLVRVNGECAS